MANNILIVIFVTSLATYLSRFLGVVSAEKIKETSKMFRWFNCLAYSTLAALIARILTFPSGTLSEVDYLIRIIVVILSIAIFYLTKKNLVYPTLFSVIILSFFSSYL
jgi:branched-subunit amino acid transport protein|tara:strand:+ start:1320 stop:1643 length:324 start_codon:yes stop_codon:yes gene_type:complete